MELDYANIYTKANLDRSDGHVSYSNGLLKFGDALLAVAYAYGITYDQVCEWCPAVKANYKLEAHPGITLEDQINFIVENHTRVPQKVLDIGGGRGEVVCFMAEVGKRLGVDMPNITIVDPGKDALEYLNESKKKYANGAALPNVFLLQKPLHELALNFRNFDTIIMVESLEHILAEHFDPEWERLVQRFRGRFIITNWLRYHPIAVGQYAPPNIHCRLVDEELYDYFSLFGNVWYRNQSHFVLDVTGKQ